MNVFFFFSGQYSCFFVYLKLIVGFTEGQVAEFIGIIGILSVLSQVSPIKKILGFL